MGISIIVALAVSGGFYAYRYFSSDAAQSSVGDCASVTGSMLSPTYAKVGCDAPNASYVVAKVLGSTSEKCGEPYSEYTEKVPRGPSSKLCLMDNFAEGACYEGRQPLGVEFRKVDCGAPNTTKISKVVKGKADGSVCEKGAIPLVFPEPPTTYCGSRDK